MKLKFFAEHILTVLLAVVVLPAAISLLLNGKMNRIYQAIQQETGTLTVKNKGKENEITLEEYVMEVTAAEIGADAPIEAVKAQMVLVRTNAWRQMKEGGVKEKERISLTDLEILGEGRKYRKAEKETRGKILTYQGEPIMASYHKLSAGQTREGEEVFRSEEYPYLGSKACPGDQKSPEYKKTIQIDDSWKDMEVEERDSAGYILRLRLGNTVMSGEEFRIVLGLPSSCFRIEKNGDGVFVITRGIGHGLGMSQYTAKKLAENGSSYQEILEYFFDQTDISDIADL